MLLLGVIDYKMQRQLSKDWMVSEKMYLFKFEHIWPNFEQYWTSLNTFEHIWTHLNEFWTNLNTFEHIWTSFEQVWTHLNTFEQVWKGFEQVEHI